jgi:hypothetical protein
MTEVKLKVVYALRQAAFAVLESIHIQIEIRHYGFLFLLVEVCNYIYVLKTCLQFLQNSLTLTFTNIYTQKWKYYMYI